MTSEEKIELAESTRRYVIQFLTNLEEYLFESGPHESFNEFTCSFGYSCSDFIMDIIVPTGIFVKEELDILNELDRYFAKLLKDHIGVQSWDNLSKEEYLKIKSLSYDYLSLIHGFKHY